MAPDDPLQSNDELALPKHDLTDQDDNEVDAGAGADLVGTEQEVEEQAEEEGKKKPKLHLDVKIDQRSTCERHITVTIPREDIDRYLDQELSLIHI